MNSLNDNNQTILPQIIRIANERSLKQLMFNNDTYSKRGRSHKTLLEQVIFDSNTIDRFCTNSLYERV